jgi:hypothetical protein
MTLLSVLMVLVAFTTTPYQNGAIGLELDLPTDAVVVATSNTPPFCLISSGNSSNIWHLRLERGIHPDAHSVEELLNFSKKESITGSEPENVVVLENNAMNARSIEGWWRVEKTEAEEENTIIARFAIPVQGNQFILASIMASEDVWKSNSELLKHTVQSIAPLDISKLVQDKLRGLDNATSVLATLSEETLQSLIGFEEWRRIQTKGKDGSTTDIGYAFIQVESGNRDEVEIRSEQNELPANGIIVSVRSRLLPNVNTGVVTDTYARYWMSWDGKEERWSNRVTRWLDNARSTDSETGIRNRPEIGSPKSKLMVLHQDLTADTFETPFKTIAEEPWLPRALVWVLGPLLQENKDDSQFIWMTYENFGDTQRVVTRSDRIQHRQDGSREIATKFGEGGDSIWTVVDERGFLIQQEQKGGGFITGTTKEILRNIWEPLNLW